MLVVLTTPVALNARPQVFAFVLLVAWTHALLRAVEDRTGPPWPALAWMLLWTNLHATFTFGLLLGGLFAAAAVAYERPGGRLRQTGRWGVFVVAAFLVACASPYGYRPMLVTATLAGVGEALPYIREWRRIDPSSVGGVVALAALSGAALLLLRHRGREGVLRLVVVALLGYMMVRYIRFVPFFALGAPLVLARPLARWRGEVVAPSPPAPWRAGLSWPLAALLAALPLAAALRIDPGPGPMSTPQAALAAARAQGLGGPVYNEYDFGGYLVAEGVRTFIDGRTDQLFLDGFITRHYRALAAADHHPLANVLDRYRVTWALVRPKSPSAKHLDAMPGWRRVHVDEFAAVYARQ
jgi:hypothetical protein